MTAHDPTTDDDPRAAALAARRRGLSLRVAAAAAGVSHTTVMRWEREAAALAKRTDDVGRGRSVERRRRLPEPLSDDERGRLVVLEGGGGDGDGGSKRASADEVRRLVLAALGTTESWSLGVRAAVARRTGWSVEDLDLVYREHLDAFCRAEVELDARQQLAAHRLRVQAATRRADQRGADSAVMRGLSQEHRLLGLYERAAMADTADAPPVLGPDELAALRREHLERLLDTPQGREFLRERARELVQEED